MTVLHSRRYRARAGIAVANIVLCVVVVSVLAAGTAGARPATPAATMTPSSGLVDGQRTTIRATGFPPDMELQVIECSGTVASPPSNQNSCEGLTLDSTGYTNAKGDYVNEPGDPSGDTEGYRITFLPGPAAKLVSNQCGPRNTCVIYVGVDYHAFNQPHVFLPMSFAGAPPLSSGGGGSSRLWLAIVIGVVIAAAAIWLLVRRKRSAGDVESPEVDQ